MEGLLDLHDKGWDAIDRMREQLSKLNIANPRDLRLTTANSLCAIQELLDHKAMIRLEQKLQYSAPQLFRHFFDGHFFGGTGGYDTVCLCTEDWKAKEHTKDYGTYFTATQMHLLLWTHIIKRTAILPLIEADKYSITNNCDCASDDAFLHFVKALVKATVAGPCMANTVEKSLRTIEGHGRTVMISDERLKKAFRIFTQMPIQFMIQLRIGHSWPKEEKVFIWCEDLEEPKGAWDTTYEYMSTSLAECYYPRRNYVL